jgi:hypothetical protein
MYRNPTAFIDIQPSPSLLRHHFRFRVFRNIRASGPQPKLEDFDDEFEFTYPANGEVFMRERTAGCEDERARVSDHLLPVG